MPAADPDIPRALVEAAIAALEAGGPSSVQARKLAAGIGTSTMAVYTYFGGMPGLWEALVREGFTRLVVAVGAVAETDNPMADFFVQGLAYRTWAEANPQLYRLMFGLSDAETTGRRRAEAGPLGCSTTVEERDAFEVMVRSMRRVIDAGQIGPVDPVMAAGQFLSATHGFVLLEIAGYFGTDGSGVVEVLAPLARSIMVGLGASPAATDAAGAVAANFAGDARPHAP